MVYIFRFQITWSLCTIQKETTCPVAASCVLWWKIVKCYIGPCKVKMYILQCTYQNCICAPASCEPGRVVPCISQANNLFTSGCTFLKKLALAAFGWNIQCEITVNLQISQYFAALRDPLGPHHSVDNILCHLVMLSFGDKRDTNMVKESLKIRILFICCHGHRSTF